jgi:hypothetical protein
MNIRSGICIALLSVTLAGTAAADQGAAEKAQPENVQAEAGMRVYVDPETGQLTSTPVTPEQRAQAESSEAFRQDDTGLRVVHMPDGSSMMDLQGRFEQATAAQVTAEGKLQTYCSDADHLKLGQHAHADAGAPVVDSNER